MLTRVKTEVELRRFIGARDLTWRASGDLIEWRDAAGRLVAKARYICCAAPAFYVDRPENFQV